MSNARVIAIEPGTSLIHLGDIPGLLARAVYPLLDDGDLAADARALNQASAEEGHRRDLWQAIRSGNLNPRSYGGHSLSADDVAFVASGSDGDGYITVEDFRAYAATRGIAVGVEPKRIVVLDLVERISAATADRHPEKWQHGEDQKIGRTIVAVMNANGWPADGIPGVLDFICKEIESGRVDAFCAFNDIPCNDVSLVRSQPSQWYVTTDDESHIIQAIGAAVTRTQERVRERTEQSEMQRIEKEAAGRYTLEEAARLIATNTDEREEATLDLLLSAVKEGTLAVHEPGRDLPYRPATVRKFYEEAYWNDFNAWLDSIRFRNPWRFPNPLRSDVRPASLAVKHEQAILSAIGALNLNPTALQRGTSRKPGAKAAIKAYIKNLTPSQFDNAWERLRAAKTIRYADESLS